LLDPRAYPEYVSNGWLKADALLLGLLYLLSKQLGLVAAGRVVAALVITATAFALPHFVLSFTDRRRLALSSLLMVPMVHHWWTLMGMLGFALAFPLALLAIVLLARQSDAPTWRRGGVVALLGAILWFAHAVVLLLVMLLALVEVARRLGQPERRRGATSLLAGVVAPLIPASGLVLATVARHATQTTSHAEFGRVDEVSFQDGLSNLYDLWAHWTFGLSPLSAASIVPAVALAFFAARSCTTPTPMLSAWALVALSLLYWFLPYMMPGFGYVNERVLPLLWAWALVRVPSSLPRSVAWLLAASGVCWSVGLGVDLLRAEEDLDAFTAGAPYVPPGTRLLTLNFASRVSSTNTWPLLHASGMYTVLRGAKPQDVWADSPSAPIRHAHPPSLVEDPVRVRQFLASAATPRDYCATLRHAGLSGIECDVRWRQEWAEFWRAAWSRYDSVLLWSAPPEVAETVPPGYGVLLARGRLELRAKAQPPSAGVEP
jgi:hypothetical protein